MSDSIERRRRKFQEEIGPFGETKVFRLPRGWHYRVTCLIGECPFRTGKKGNYATATAEWHVHLAQHEQLDR